MNGLLYNIWCTYVYTHHNIVEWMQFFVENHCTEQYWYTFVHKKGLDKCEYLTFAAEN